MKMRMKEINLLGGETLDEVYVRLRKAENCFCLFNGKELTSYDTLDEIYLKVTGCCKEDYLKKCEESRLKQEKEEKENKEKILIKIIENKHKINTHLFKFNVEKFLIKMVENYHNSFYSLKEYEAVFDIMCQHSIEEMKQLLIDQNHSGLSRSIVIKILNDCCNEKIEIF